VTSISHLIKKLIKIKIMEFKKKTLNEAMDTESNGKKTFSKKSQNIIISEEQLERLIEKMKNN
jgi:hypothetical protein